MIRVRIAARKVTKANPTCYPLLVSASLGLDDMLLMIICVVSGSQEPSFGPYTHMLAI